MAEVIYCPECNQPVLAEADACNHCGAEVGPGLDRADIWHGLRDKLAAATSDTYEVDGLIGYGGMAGVYLAKDTRLNRHVALKLISPAVLMDPKMVRRFRQEAQTMAQLNHRHIVPVYDIRESDDLLFIVMQYVPGRTLAEVVTDSREPLKPELVATWMVQVSEALAHAHGRQTAVVHRDIKPSNIILDETGEAQLTDFGIAKVQGDAGLTRTGHLIGTPAYMSPEQCRGAAITAASDQYSLGTVAYELLAGVPPFRGPTLMVLQAHSGEEPKRLINSRPECPPALASVVERMLAKAPEDRWPDMAQVSEELRNAIDGLAPSATLQSFAKRVREIGLDAKPTPLTLGTSERLVARLLDGDGEELVGRRIHWASTDGGVASVTAEGVLGAKGLGSAVIVGRSGGAVTTMEVEVVAPAADRVEIEPAEIDIQVGQEVQVVVSVLTESGAAIEAGKVQWVLDDPEVADVSADGLVTGRAPGAAALNVSIGALTQRVEVVVRAVPVATLRISPAQVQVGVGEQQALTVRVESGEGRELQDRVVEWLSADPAVVTVSPTGAVEGVGPGTAVVTAQCEGVSEAVAIEVRGLPASSDMTRVIDGDDWGTPQDLRPPVTSEAPAFSQMPELADPPTSKSIPAAPPAGDDARTRVIGSEGAPLVPAPPPAADKTNVMRPAAPSGGAAVAERSAGGRPPSDIGPATAGAPGAFSDRRVQVGVGVAAVAVIAFLMRGLGGGAAGAPLVVSVAPGDTTVQVGDQFTLRAGAPAADLQGRNSAWASSDLTVARVSEDGVVEAIGPGMAALSLAGDGVESDGPWTLTVLPAGAVAVTENPEGPAGGGGDQAPASAPSETPSTEPAPVPARTTTTQADPPPSRTQPARAQAETPPAEPQRPPPGQILEPEPEGQVPARLVLDPAEVGLTVGEARPLSASIFDQEDRAMPPGSVTWSSSAPATLTVDASGQVAAVAPGSAWITATQGSLVDSVRFDVAAATVPLGASPTPADAASLVGEFVQLLGGGGNRVLGLIPMTERGEHERYVTAASEGRLEAGGAVENLNVDGTTVTFTLPIRARTAFGSTRNGSMDFIAQLAADDGAWALVRVVPAPGSSPP